MKKITLVTLLCLLSSLATAETFYRWKDAQGATHYTTTPPQGQNSTSLEVHTGVTSSVPADSDKKPTAKPVATASSSAEKDEPKTEVSSYQERCDQYRENLKLLQSNSQLTMKDKDGELHTLSKEERAKQEARAKEMLTACPPADK